MKRRANTIDEKLPYPTSCIRCRWFDEYSEPQGMLCLKFVEPISYAVTMEKFCGYERKHYVR